MVHTLWSYDHRMWRKSRINLIILQIFFLIILILYNTHADNHVGMISMHGLCNCHANEWGYTGIFDWGGGILRDRLLYKYVFIFLYKHIFMLLCVQETCQKRLCKYHASFFYAGTMPTPAKKICRVAVYIYAPDIYRPKIQGLLTILKFTQKKRCIQSRKHPP